MNAAKFGLDGFVGEPTNNDLPPSGESEPGDYGYTITDEPGCAYCSSFDVFRAEPFGGQPACVRCWNRICLDEDTDVPFVCVTTDSRATGDQETS